MIYVDPNKLIKYQYDPEINHITYLFVAEFKIYEFAILSVWIKNEPDNRILTEF